MSENRYTKALFASLVYNEAGELAEVAYIGQEAHYVILDGDFKRHVTAKDVDLQVIRWLQEQITSHKDIVTESMMTMLGQDDLFTKAMIDSSINKIDTLLETGIPEDAKMWLGMMGFKVVVNFHGEVVEITAPIQEDFDGFD